MADDTLSIRVTADISSLQANLPAAAATVEDFNARAKGAMDAYNAAAAQGEDVQEMLGAAFDKAHLAGASFVEAIEAANVAFQGYTSAAMEAQAATLATASAEEGAQIDVLTAAQRQFAEATLDAVAARKALNETVGESAELSDADAITLLAAAQRRATATAEQLALAKRNLAEAEEFAATAAAQEAGAVSEAAGAEEAGTAAIETRFAALEESTAATSAYVSGTLAANGALRVAEGSMMGATRAAASFLTTTLRLGPVLELAFPVIGALALGDVIYGIIEKFEDLKRTANEAADNIEESFRKATDAIQDSTASIESETDRAQSQIDKLLGHPSQNGAKIAFDEAAEAAARLGSVIDADIEKTDQLISEQNKKNTVGFWQSLFTGKAETGDTQKLIQQAEDAIKSKNAEYEQPMELAEESGNKGSLASLQQDRLVDLEKVYADAEQKIGASLKSLQDKQADFIETGFGTDQTAKINLLVGALEKWHAEQRNIGAEYAKANVQGELTAAETARVQTPPELKVGPSRIAEALQRENEAARKQVEEYQHTLDDLERIDAIFAKAQDEAATAAQKAATRAEEAAAQHQHDQNVGGIQTQETNVEDSQALGLTNPTKALEQLRTLHEQMTAEDERFIAKEMAIYAKEPAELQRLQKQLDEIHENGLEQQLKETTKILRQEQKVAELAYQTIANDLNQAINKMITSTEKPAQIFAQMFNKILEQAATFTEKYIENQAEMWVKNEAAQATGQSASKALSLSQIAQAAGTAAANTYASVSAIPIVGPVLAPPAAAVAYAAVLAFEAFEAGGVVGGSHGMPVPIMAHAGERVLSSAQTNNFERMVNQPQSGGHSTHINYSPNINAFDRNGFRSTLSAHKDDILDIVKQGYKAGKLQ